MCDVWEDLMTCRAEKLPPRKKPAGEIFDENPASQFSDREDFSKNCIFFLPQGTRDAIFPAQFRAKLKLPLP